MAAIDTDIINKLDKVGGLVERLVDALHEWKTENDTRRAGLDAMGEELLKCMVDIRNIAHKYLPTNKSSSKSVPSNESSAKHQPASLQPIPLAQRSPIVRLEVLQPTTSTSNQQKASTTLKSTAKRIPIKKEIDTTENTDGLPKLMPPNVTPLPRLLLPPVAIKKEPSDTSTSRVTGLTSNSRSKNNLKRKPETSVVDDTSKIPRTTRSQAKTVLSNDIMKPNRVPQGLAGASTRSSKVPDHVKKVSKVGVKRRQSHV